MIRRILRWFRQYKTYDIGPTLADEGISLSDVIDEARAKLGPMPRSRFMDVVCKENGK